MKTKRETTAADELLSPHPMEPDCGPLGGPRPTGNVERLKAALAVRQKRQRRRRTQVAVGGALLLLIAAFTWQYSSRTIPIAEISSHAIVTTPERRILSDGTIVELKDHSEIAVD